MYTDDESGGGRYKSNLFLLLMKKQMENGKTVIFMDTEATIDLYGQPGDNQFIDNDMVLFAPDENKLGLVRVEPIKKRKKK